MTVGAPAFITPVVALTAAPWIRTPDFARRPGAVSRSIFAEVALPPTASVMLAGSEVRFSTMTRGPPDAGFRA